MDTNPYNSITDERSGYEQQLNVYPTGSFSWPVTDTQSINEVPLNILSNTLSRLSTKIENIRDTEVEKEKLSKINIELRNQIDKNKTNCPKNPPILQEMSPVIKISSNKLEVVDIKPLIDTYNKFIIEVYEIYNSLIRILNKASCIGIKIEELVFEPLYLENTIVPYNETVTKFYEIVQENINSIRETVDNFSKYEFNSKLCVFKGQ